MPFYLLSYLEHSLVNHVKNNENPIFHEVLSCLIMEYAQAREIKPSLVVNNPKSSDNPEVQVVLDTKIDEEGMGDMAMD